MKTPSTAVASTLPPLQKGAAASAGPPKKRTEEVLNQEIEDRLSRFRKQLEFGSMRCEWHDRVCKDLALEFSEDIFREYKL